MLARGRQTVQRCGRRAIGRNGSRNIHGGAALGHATRTRAHATVCAAFVALCAAGCQLSPEGRHLLLETGASYNRTEYGESVRQADLFLAQHGRSPEAAEALYVRALSRIRQRRVADARADLRAALSRSERDDLTARVHAQLGLLAFDAKRWAVAADHLGKAIGALDAAPPTDEILLRSGLALQRAGHWNQARQQFAQVVRQYGARPSGRRARRQLAWRDPHFAIQCGAYTDPTEADRRIAALTARRLTARRAWELRDNRSLWIVYAGPYATYAQAAAVLAGVRSVAADAFIAP